MVKRSCQPAPGSPRNQLNHSNYSGGLTQLLRPIGIGTSKACRFPPIFFISTTSLNSPLADWLCLFIRFSATTLFPLITNRDLHMLMTECAPTSGRHLLDEPVDFSVSYSATQSALVPSWSSLFPPETGN